MRKYKDTTTSRIALTTVGAVCDIFIEILDKRGSEGVIRALEDCRKEEYSVPEALFEEVMDYLDNEVRPKLEADLATSH